MVRMSCPDNEHQVMERASPLGDAFFNDFLVAVGALAGIQSGCCPTGAISRPRQIHAFQRFQLQAGEASSDDPGESSSNWDSLR